jgi:poly-beta-hydroxybutyrate-responsive repressor
MSLFTERPRSALPKNFLRPCLLLLLSERPSHGYDLVERLEPLGFDGADHGRLYRALRSLEGEGLVCSSWAPSASGPHRRVYELTGSGRDGLHQAVTEITATHTILDAFLCRCEGVHSTDSG